ncbi:MAG: DNA polymerase IV [Marinoscillum sp.]|uniref:DNA polymerase IV n=1 Tax=unclassified Marinoscillum TaxID=2624039 RepID=UPI0012F1E35A|nr:DNA polymerase IV [Marinoscillum sp. 108]VXD16169.1 DNA polymerase IV [Marinoscillum sp. 108]
MNSILHLDLDTFFVSVERLKNSALVGKPVLIGGTSDRGVVAACSYEARRFGVHSAMPMKLARALCPEAIIVRGNSADYTKHSKMVTDIIQEAVPVLEKSSIDEFYVDLTGMDKFFGAWKMATELRTRIVKESGLPISFGLSENKTVSKVATNEAKPNNHLRIDYGQEKPFLAPLSVKKIPMVGDKTYSKLMSLGVRKIYTLQQMSVDLMERAFGANGVTIWRKANGIDYSKVVPYSERKSISTERTFDRDTIDVVKLKGILVAMTENLGFQLRRGEKLTSCITVKVRYSDFNTYTLQAKIPYTAADHALIPKALDLFDRLYNKRLLVRLIGIRMSDLVNGFYQIDLFDDSEEQLNLYHAMDAIRDRYGDRSVMRASGMLAKTIGRWNPFTGEPPPLLANRRR